MKVISIERIPAFEAGLKAWLWTVLPSPFLLVIGMGGPFDPDFFPAMAVVIWFVAGVWGLLMCGLVNIIFMEFLPFISRKGLKTLSEQLYFGYFLSLLTISLGMLSGDKALFEFRSEGLTLLLLIGGITALGTVILLDRNVHSIRRLVILPTDFLPGDEVF